LRFYFPHEKIARLNLGGKVFPQRKTCGEPLKVRSSGAERHRALGGLLKASGKMDFAIKKSAEDFVFLHKKF